MEIIYTDCLVIGSGLAGSTYANVAAEKGLHCVMITTESDWSNSNSNYAQGGIIYDAEGDPELLVQDLKLATNDCCNPEAVEIVVERGPEIVENILLNDLKIPFDRDEKNNLLFTKEGAHSRSRIIYCKDKTGEIILKGVHNGLKKKSNLSILKSHMAIDLITLSHSSKKYTDRYKPLTCFGAYVLDFNDNKVKAIVAKRTILSTGGIGQIFLNTTNFSGAFGHGVAMAYRVGARVMDMEYIQFHPTAFYQKNSSKRSFLISETVRGEGGVLINSRGEAFMDHYHPLKSLAPRDIIARSINFEMIKCQSPCVYIELSNLNKDYIKSRFPTIYQRCLDGGVDITKEPIPVAPAAHYFCGGIHTTMSGATNIKGLRAIGETSCTGLHGANRLASTSLLECVVMGKLAADEDAAELSVFSDVFPEIKEWKMSVEIADDNLIKQDLALIKNTMWNYVGLVRSGKRLERAQSILAELKNEIDQFYAQSALTPNLLNLRNAVQISLLVVYAAYRNRTSNGCHYRVDT